MVGKKSMLSLLCLFVFVQAHEDVELQEESCDVVMIGGSVAGLSAAVTSAKEGILTCLLVPTDMMGGQMTANGVPALDFSSENGRMPFNTSGAASDTMMANHAHDLTTLLRSLPPPNHNHTCWVSPYCYLPTELEKGGIQQILESAGATLKIFRQTVLLNATTRTHTGEGNQTVVIESVTAVKRTPKANAKCEG